MIDNKPEKPYQSLSFLEQLQNQIQLCREAMSDYHIPLTPRVEALESFLWAKLKEDQEYLDRIDGLSKWLEKKKQDIKNKPDMHEWKLEKELVPYQRYVAKERFKAIMVFIDKKKYMPLGEQQYG